MTHRHIYTFMSVMADDDKDRKFIIGVSIVGVLFLIIMFWGDITSSFRSEESQQASKQAEEADDSQGNVTEVQRRTSELKTTTVQRERPQGQRTQESEVQRDRRRPGSPNRSSGDTGDTQTNSYSEIRNDDGDIVRVSKVLNLYTNPDAAKTPKEDNTQNTDNPPKQADKEKEKTPDNFAPYGRMIKCTLVNTVDTFNIQTPIIALVEKKVTSPDGDVIIPAGTEIHGMAKTDRRQERIATDTNWIAVMKDGRELRINGVALDRDVRIQDKSWGVTDGSYGIKGYTVRSSDMEELKLWASVFFQGVAEQFQELDVSNTGFGAQPFPTPNSLRNPAVSGLSRVLEDYAGDIKEEIQKKGFFTRVPAGEQFYLYVQQTLDASSAKIGNIGNTDTASSQQKTRGGGNQSVGLGGVSGLSSQAINEAIKRNNENINRIRNEATNNRQ